MADNTNGKPGVLTIEQIIALRQNTRVRGVYPEKLVEFENSDDAVIIPAEVWPLEFGGKSASTLSQGFKGAIKTAKAEDTFQVSTSDGVCYLYHKERVNLLMAEYSAESEEVPA